MADWYDPAELWVDSGTLGEEQEIHISRSAEMDCTNTITYKCGDLEGTVVKNTSSWYAYWTPPLSLAEANPNGKYIYVTLTVTTYVDSEEIGSTSTEVFYNIPSSVAPTFTVDFTDDAGYKNTYGSFLQHLSRLKIKVNVTEAYGSPIKSYKITVNGETFTTAEAVARAIDKYGSIQVYVAVQDARGSLVQQYLYVSFSAYSSPTVSTLTIKRCNADGTANDQGSYIQATYSAKADSLDSKNTVSYKLEYKKSTASSFTTVNLTQFNNDFYISGETYIFPADTGTSYNVQLTVTDAFMSVTRTAVGSTAATILHWKANGKGIGLGKISEVDNAVDVGWKINMNNCKIYNLATPTSAADAATKQYVDNVISKVYPVGAIYISTVSTSPASLFGGTWTQLKERFLYAANDSNSTYANGKQGGATTHTLTEYEIPEHSHRFLGNMPGRNTVENTYGEDFAIIGQYGYRDDLIETAGGGASHNNMPPWLAVYMWKRTA